MTDRRLSIPVDKIHVPEDYLRPISEAAANGLAQLIQNEGQKSPIAVYASSARGNGKPYTLIYGARRLRAMQILGRDEIEAVLRSKADAPMLSISDNLAMPTLDALEEAEYVVAFRNLWEAENGPVRRGGDRKSKRQNGALIDEANHQEIPNLFNDLNNIFGISKRTAHRLFKYGSIHKTLRDALRGSEYVRDRTYLAKLAKLNTAQQAAIAGALSFNPDLAAVLRAADPATERKSIGRMERLDWQELHVQALLDKLPAERREALLDQYGYLKKPINPWPEELPRFEVIPHEQSRSPLWKLLDEPFANLSVNLTYKQIQKIKAEYAEEDKRDRQRFAERLARTIQANEDLHRDEYNAGRDAEKLKKERRRQREKRARKKELKDRARIHQLQAWFPPKLADALFATGLPLDDAIIKFCRGLNPEELDWVYYHLENGHHWSDIPWRVDTSRGYEASEILDPR